MHINWTWMADMRINDGEWGEKGKRHTALKSGHWSASPWDVGINFSVFLKLEMVKMFILMEALDNRPQHESHKGSFTCHMAG